MARHRFLLTLAVVAGGCGDAPHALPDARLVESCATAEIEVGGPCALAPTARCLIDDYDCAVAKVCWCQGGVYACAAPDFAGGCGDIDDAHCAIEGVNGCYQHPTSGSRWCQDGAWHVDYSCPAGCPDPDATPPEAGDDCTVATGAVCVYQSTQCECVAGHFRCCDDAPCE